MSESKPTSEWGRRAIERFDKAMADMNDLGAELRAIVGEPGAITNLKVEQGKLGTRITLGGVVVGVLAAALIALAGFGFKAISDLSSAAGELKGAVAEQSKEQAAFRQDMAGLRASVKDLAVAVGKLQVAADRLNQNASMRTTVSIVYLTSKNSAKTESKFQVLLVWKLPTAIDKDKVASSQIVVRPFNEGSKSPLTGMRVDSIWGEVGPDGKTVRITIESPEADRIEMALFKMDLPVEVTVTAPK